MAPTTSNVQQEHATGNEIYQSLSPVKTVPVGLPEYIWGRLATIAEHREVKVADLIAEGIRHVLDTDPGRLAQLSREVREAEKARGSKRVKFTDDLVERIRVLHGDGFSDREIGGLLGVSAEGVRKRRNRMGLPVNRRGRRPDVEIAQVALILRNGEAA